MTYYKDLSPYEYFRDYEPFGLNLINVGWLSKSEPFPEGETSQEFKAKLFEFCLDEYVVQITRGFHTCEFCGGSHQGNPQYGEAHDLARLGNGEIRVIGQSALYAAPTLIHHYVVDHRYNPPEEFIKAVLSGPPPGSREHENVLNKYKLA
ncbi:MAG: hypothetical protein KME19_14375 [Microcoleus vaginatus WJT46-NPBG5]|jgi:hypothetical protein|nr:hypothetical protein [Microcoleus vaginatus WJT46-NPBG5]